MSTKMGREGVSFVDLSTTCQPLSTVVNRCQPLVDLSTPWLTRLTTTERRVTVDKLSTIVDLVDLVDLSTCRPVDLSTICQPLSTTVVDLSSRGSGFNKPPPKAKNLRGIDSRSGNAQRRNSPQIPASPVPVPCAASRAPRRRVVATLPYSHSRTGRF